MVISISGNKNDKKRKVEGFIPETKNIKTDVSVSE